VSHVVVELHDVCNMAKGYDIDDCCQCIDVQSRSILHSSCYPFDVYAIQAFLCHFIALSRSCHKPPLSLTLLPICVFKCMCQGRPIYYLADTALAHGRAGRCIAYSTVASNLTYCFTPICSLPQSILQNGLREDMFYRKPTNRKHSSERSGCLSHRHHPTF